MQLAESWSQEPDQVQVGQPVTRTLALIADGLTSAQLPPLTGGPLPDGLKAYPDQPALQDQETADGITGSRQQKTALVASRPGDYTLPGIEIHWWSTETNRRETLSIPARRIQVVAAPGGSAPAEPTPEPAAAPAIGEPGPDTPEEGPTAPTAEPAGGPFVWLTLFLGIGWLATALAWWRSHRRAAKHQREPPRSRSKPSLRNAAAQVRRAYRARDAAAATHALLEWGRVRWPDDPPTNLGELGRRANPELARSIAALNRARYAREPTTTWHQDPVWRVLETPRAETKRRALKRATTDPLAELNP
jgi:hypothetical protein